MSCKKCDGSVKIDTKEIILLIKLMIDKSLHQMKDEYRKAEDSLRVSGGLSDDWYESKHWIDALEHSLLIINGIEEQFIERQVINQGE